jgi:hypothetical protein
VWALAFLFQVALRMKALKTRPLPYLGLEMEFAFSRENDPCLELTLEARPYLELELSPLEVVEH